MKRLNPGFDKQFYSNFVDYAGNVETTNRKNH